MDPLYYDKPYLLAPDKRSAKPYALLAAAMRQCDRCALGKWAWKVKQYIMLIRAVAGGLVLQQLLYADEVRSLDDLHIEGVEVTAAELQLALQFIDQISEDAYHPTQYVDEEKKRILAAIDEKIAGKQVVATVPHAESGESAQIIDLLEALRASLAKKPPSPKAAVAPIQTQPVIAPKEREGAKRATDTGTTAQNVALAAPAKARAARK